jgi:hypothetical protein
MQRFALPYFPVVGVGRTVLFGTIESEALIASTSMTPSVTEKQAKSR